MMANIVPKVPLPVSYQVKSLQDLAIIGSFQHIHRLCEEIEVSSGNFDEPQCKKNLGILQTFINSWIPPAILDRLRNAVLDRETPYIFNCGLYRHQKDGQFTNNIEPELECSLKDGRILCQILLHKKTKILLYRNVQHTCIKNLTFHSIPNFWAKHLSRMSSLEYLGMTDCGRGILDVINVKCPKLSCIDLFYSRNHWVLWSKRIPILSLFNKAKEELQRFRKPINDAGSHTIIPSINVLLELLSPIIHSSPDILEVEFMKKVKQHSIPCTSLDKEIDIALKSSSDSVISGLVAQLNGIFLHDSTRENGNGNVNSQQKTVNCDTGTIKRTSTAASNDPLLSLTVTLDFFPFDMALMTLLINRGVCVQELILDHLKTPIEPEMITVIGELCPNIKILSLISFEPSIKATLTELCYVNASSFNSLRDVTVFGMNWDPRIILYCLAYAKHVHSITVIGMLGGMEVWDTILRTLFTFNPLSELEDIALQSVAEDPAALEESTFRHFYDRCSKLKYINVGEEPYIDKYIKEMERSGKNLEIDMFEIQHEDLYNFHYHHTRYQNPKRKMRSRVF